MTALTKLNLSLAHVSLNLFRLPLFFMSYILGFPQVLRQIPVWGHFPFWGCLHFWGRLLFGVAFILGVLFIFGEDHSTLMVPIYSPKTHTCGGISVWCSYTNPQWSGSIPFPDFFKDVLTRQRISGHFHTHVWGYRCMVLIYKSKVVPFDTYPIFFSRQPNTSTNQRLF